MSHQVPYLRAGVGGTPAEGGCILQVIDWLDRMGWGDNPECVSPTLQVLAIMVNDNSYNDERQRLLKLTSRLMGTGYRSADFEWSLAAWVLRTTCGRYLEEPVVQETIAYLENPVDGSRIPELIHDHWRGLETQHISLIELVHGLQMLAADRAARESVLVALRYGMPRALALMVPSYEFLVATLDEFDRRTGRGQFAPVSDEQWEGVCKVMAHA